MPRFRTGRRRDGSTYHYPITSRIGRRRVGRNVLRYRPPMRILPPIQPVKVGESLLSNALTSVLYQTPIFTELHSAYVLADSIYSNWSLIKELYEGYRREGWAGVVDSEAVHFAVSSIQTSIIWGVIKGAIPERFHDKSLDILSTVVDKITDEEIRYVKSFLQETK